jgi:drug/metabolite transporter (DMT)-like permease
LAFFALALILVAAVMHATWNLLAKHAGGGAEFVWLFSVLAAAIYAPFVLAVLIVQRPRIGAIEVIFLVGSALLQMAYFLLLQKGYSLGDLSLVYPLARGTGPLIATIAAIALFGERPSPIAVTGTLLIGGGIWILAGSPLGRRSSGVQSAVVFALLTGATIAAYTLWDKQAVGVLRIPPLLQDWCGTSGQSLLLAPYLLLRRRPQVRAEWRAHRREALGIALLSPLAYLLVLIALTFTAVSYVAPAREISILFGTVMGTRLLAEGHGRRRLVGAGTMVLGIAALVAR